MPLFLLKIGDVMKNNLKIIVILLVLLLTACNSFRNKDTETDHTNTKMDALQGLFDNVANIKIYNGLDNKGSYYLTFNDKKALDSFINDIDDIKEALKIELLYGRFENKVDNIEELYDYQLFNLGFKSIEDEELLDMRCITLVIDYDDDRPLTKIYEFIDGYEDIFDKGDGIKVIYNNEVSFYENKANIIARKLVSLLKDNIAYVKIYNDGKYYVTNFLNPIEVKTDDYTIKGSYYYAAFYTDYWDKYISTNNFKLYKLNSSEKLILNEENVVKGLPYPNDNKLQNIYLADEKGNIYQYAYDRSDSYKCTSDQEDIHIYYCKYEKD